MKRSMPNCRCSSQPTSSGEQRVREHAERHRSHPADAVAEPAEEHATGGSADEERGGDNREPQADASFIAGPAFCSE